MAVNPSPEAPFNSTTQSSETTQTVALSSSSKLETGVGGGKANGNE